MESIINIYINQRDMTVQDNPTAEPDNHIFSITFGQTSLFIKHSIYSTNSYENNELIVFNFTMVTKDISRIRNIWLYHGYKTYI